MDFTASFPAQKLPYKSKGKAWREQCVDWGASRSYFNYSPIRQSVVNMKINYDLVNGVIHMDDIASVLNPGDVVTAFVPDKIQHFPIINSKLNTLRGEEAARVFDWHVIVTNPNAVSEIEEERRRQFNEMVRGIVADQSITDEQAAEQLQEGKEYYDRDYQDSREVRGNETLKHYSKEQNFPQIFNDGFMDACICANEIYQCGISGGEPFLRKLNPMKLRIYRSGYSNRIEDADVLIYEDYWSRGRILDEYYDDLTSNDVKWLTDDIQEGGGQSPIGAAGNYNEAFPFNNGGVFVGQEGILFDNVLDELAGFYDGGISSSLNPYDIAGNVRVMKMWWKSVRKILKVTSIDPETGEEVFDFYPETYVVDKDAGETATPLWVNQAWEGTKIGDKIYCRIRPCLVQYNSMSNPSRCHFGIIGTIYNLNESKPYSLVDMMKPYNYLYDAVHAKLVDLIASNWGKLLVLDLAKKPKDWEVEKWIYFARANKTLIEDSFKEGDKGAALGKLAGGLNNASKGYIDADWGQSIQNYIVLLQSIKDSMSELVGINRQREGNTYSRETVGGIERAVLQSSYITDWLFKKHEDTKRRVLDCFIETTKAAVRGRTVKFQYILSDGSRRLMEFDGDEFADCDYGTLVDNSNDTQKLYQSIESFAQAGLQRGILGFGPLMKLYQDSSLSEKTRMIEEEEKKIQQQQQQAQQQQMQLEQQKIQAQQQTAQMQMQQQDVLNQRDNETKIRVAEINSQAEYLRLGIYAEENDEQLVHEKLDVEREKLRNDILALDKEFNFKREELKQKKEIEIKKIEAQKQIAKAKSTSTSTSKK